VCRHCLSGKFLACSECYSLGFSCLDGTHSLELHP
jgi:hypothetical protein